MIDCLIGLGANLGNRLEQLKNAVRELQASSGVQDVIVSSVYSSKPAGGPEEQGEFLNAVARLRTSVSPNDLLCTLQRIEKELGRERVVHWGPRSIDLDLLQYGDLVLDTPTLQLPHSRYSFRRFVLEPAAEIAAELRHAVIPLTIGELLNQLNTSLPFIAISSRQHADARDVAQRVASRLGAEFCQNPCGHGDDTNAPDRQIEVLSSALGRLNREESSWLISDFWIPETQLLAKGQVTNETPVPRLHVRLGAPNIVDCEARIEEQVEARLTQNTFMRLRDKSTDQAVAEICAAVESMSPVQRVHSLEN